MYLILLNVHLLFSPVKEKEDAHTDPEFQPMKDDDCTFGEYRWEKVLRPLEPPEPIFTHQPLAPPLAFCPYLLSLAGLELCSPSLLLNPYSWPITDQGSPIVETRRRRRRWSELLPSWSTRFLFWVFGTCYLCWTLLWVGVLDMTLCCHLRSRILQVQGIYGFGC